MDKDSHLLLEIFIKISMLIHFSKFSPLLFRRRNNVNTYNFFYCSVTNELSALRFKETSTDMFMYIYICPAYDLNDTLNIFLEITVGDIIQNIRIRVSIGPGYLRAWLDGYS